MLYVGFAPFLRIPTYVGSFVSYLLGAGEIVLKGAEIFILPYN